MIFYNDFEELYAQKQTRAVVFFHFVFGKPRRGDRVEFGQAFAAICAKQAELCSQLQRVWMA